MEHKSARLVTVAGRLQPRGDRLRWGLTLCGPGSRRVSQEPLVLAVINLLEDLGVVPGLLQNSVHRLRGRLRKSKPFDLESPSTANHFGSHYTLNRVYLVGGPL
jgi:hypothetical protein